MAGDILVLNTPLNIVVGSAALVNQLLPDAETGIGLRQE